MLSNHNVVDEAEGGEVLDERNLRHMLEMACYA